jgi:hypothetical protein
MPPQGFHGDSFFQSTEGGGLFDGGASVRQPAQIPRKVLKRGRSNPLNIRLANISLRI